MTRQHDDRVRKYNRCKAGRREADGEDPLRRGGAAATEF